MLLSLQIKYGKEVLFSAFNLYFKTKVNTLDHKVYVASRLHAFSGFTEIILAIHSYTKDCLGARLYFICVSEIVRQMTYFSKRYSEV